MNFLVVNNGNTFVGALYDDNIEHKHLLREDLIDSGDTRSITVHERHGGNISNVLYCDKFNMVLVGDCAGNLTQYDFDSLKTRGRIVRNYGDIGIDAIVTSRILDHIVVLGGNNSLVRFLNLKDRELIGPPLQTSVGSITSVELCPIVRKRRAKRDSKRNYKCAKSRYSNVYLSVSGNTKHIFHRDNANEKTNLFEIIDLWKDEYCSNLRENEVLRPIACGLSRNFFEGNQDLSF